MRRKISAVLFFTCLFSSPLLAAVQEQTMPLLDQAQKLQKEGKYLEAQKIYRQVLKEVPLEAGEMKRVREEYENLNLKILFSRLESPGSEFYEVKPADSLYGIAKKFHTTSELIKKSNALSSDKIYPGMKLKIIKGRFSILVKRSENVLTLFLEGEPLKHYPVATGQADKTPVGEFKIVNKLENPTWFRAGAIVPPGSPENSLGTRWLGFDDPGYGIHGTIQPESIGHSVTSGCVRMLNEEVEELYSLVPLGTKVTIAD